MENYYDILQISKDASQIEIKQSFQKLALIYHPDRNKCPESVNTFQQISNAYQVNKISNLNINTF